MSKNEALSGEYASKPSDPTYDYTGSYTSTKATHSGISVGPTLTSTSFSVPITAEQKTTAINIGASVETVNAVNVALLHLLSLDIDDSLKMEAVRCLREALVPLKEPVSISNCHFS